jgi:hypothetical protein
MMSSAYSKKQRGQCLTLTALKPCLAAPNRAFAGHCRAYRATPRLNQGTPRLTGPRKYYYGLLATKFQTTTNVAGKRTASPCECHGNHGERRGAVKNDPSTPPTDASAIQVITPSDVFSWPGPVEHLTQSSERTGIDNNWFALTGRVVAVKVEMDGDLHIALQDATGDKAGIVVFEVPAKPQWCEVRNTVLNWTRTRFPFPY